MPKRILIVDDDPYIQMLMQHTLEELKRQDVELLTASNGHEAIQLIKAQRPNLVFLDVMMPQINGFAVCRTIKRDLQMKDVYIVIVSVRNQNFDQQHGLEIGANHYITKPFDPTVILNMAIEVLDLTLPDHN